MRNTHRASFCDAVPPAGGTLVASPADRATGQGALSPCRQGITSINGWSNNGANLHFWREILVPALSGPVGRALVRCAQN